MLWCDIPETLPLQLHVRNQSACLHRWGEIWFISFFLNISFLGLLGNQLEKNRNHESKPFYIDLLYRHMSQKITFVNFDHETMQSQWLSGFLSIPFTAMCLVPQILPGTDLVFETYLLTEWMDYNCVFMREFFLKIPKEFLISINVTILVGLFLPTKYSKSTFDLSIINVCRISV